MTALLNDGGGSWSPVTKGVGGRPYGVAAGDFDEDGFNDLAVTIPGNNEVAIFINDQNGDFNSPVFISAGIGPAAITAGDLDGDADIDLAITSSSGTGVQILRNDGTGAFVVEDSGSIGSGVFPNPLAVSILVAQLDDESNLDFAIANGQGSESVLFLSNRLVDRAQKIVVQNGSTTSGVVFAVANSSSGSSADFDSDGLVTGLDFLAWQIGYPTTAPNASKSDGDADNDQDVDRDDLLAWESQYGTAAPLSALSTSLQTASESNDEVFVAEDSKGEGPGLTTSVSVSPESLLLSYPTRTPQSASEGGVVEDSIVEEIFNEYGSEDSGNGTGNLGRTTRIFDDVDLQILLAEDDDEQLDTATEEVFESLSNEALGSEF